MCKVATKKHLTFQSLWTLLYVDWKENLIKKNDSFSPLEIEKSKNKNNVLVYVCGCVLVCIHTRGREVRRYPHVSSLGVNQETNIWPFWSLEGLPSPEEIEAISTTRPCLSLYRFSSQCDLSNKASLIPSWIVLGNLSLCTAKKLQLNLDNTPGILISCTVWRWHNLSFCPSLHLSFKSRVSPILSVWIQNVREGAGCACKPPCQVPDSQMVTPTPGRELIKDLIKQAALCYTVAGVGIFFFFPLALLLFPWHF